MVHGQVLLCETRNGVREADFGAVVCVRVGTAKSRSVRKAGFPLGNGRLKKGLAGSTTSYEASARECWEALDMNDTSTRPLGSLSKTAVGDPCTRFL